MLVSSETLSMNFGTGLLISNPLSLFMADVYMDFFEKNLYTNHSTLYAIKLLQYFDGILYACVMVLLS